MKCRYCGREFSLKLKKCPFCGKAERDEKIKENYESNLDDLIYSKKRKMGLKDHKKITEEARRRTFETERRKKKQKRARNRLISVIVLICSCVCITYFVYSNSYQGLVNSGNKYRLKGHEEEAIKKYKKAIKKSPDLIDAYEGMSEIYLDKGEKEKAEKLYNKAIKNYPDKVDLYNSFIKFYEKTNQPDKIASLMKDCKNQGVRDDLNKYVSDGPKFSLKGGTYDDVQQLTLTSSESDIYYTDDNTKPGKSSKKYKEPIQIGEGKTIIRAIAYNKGDVPSTEVKEEYNVDIPLVDAPSVSPSTGVYNSPKKITVKVPEGYICYYTITPKGEEVKKPTIKDKIYKDPIDMPKGKNIFCAVLIDGKNRQSDYRIMNYDLSEK